MVHKNTAVYICLSDCSPLNLSFYLYTLYRTKYPKDDIEEAIIKKRIRKSLECDCLSECPGEGEVSKGEDHQLLVERGDLYLGHDRPRF